MRRTLRAVLALLVLSGCSSAAVSQSDYAAKKRATVPAASHAALMDEIESRVVLPKRALPLADYQRFYALGEPGKVRGVYRASSTNAGERHWYDDAKQLPEIMDGGCGVLELDYDLTTKRVDVWCHGSA